MDRRGFIKSTGIGLAALILAGTLPKVAEAVPEPELPKVYHAEITKWYFNQFGDSWEAIVYGHDKKTLEIKSLWLTIPDAEVNYMGRDMRAEAVLLARQQLIEDGCIPL